MTTHSFEDVTRFATDRTWAETHGIYDTPAEADARRDDDVARVLRHLSTRPTDGRVDPDARRRRAAELLAIGVEDQLRHRPGGRLWLSSHAGPFDVLAQTHDNDRTATP